MTTTNLGMLQKKTQEQNLQLPASLHCKRLVYLCTVTDKMIILNSSINILFLLFSVFKFLHQDLQQSHSQQSDFHLPQINLN